MHVELPHSLQSPTWWWRGLLLLHLCVLLLSVACEREFTGRKPPLQPLIYTELPPSEDNPEEEEPPTMQYIAPDDLGYALFHSIVTHHKEEFEQMRITPQELADLVRLPMERAERDVAKFRENHEKLWALFSLDHKSAEPYEAISAKLNLSQFRLGKGRTLAGKTATADNEEAVQHWGNELQLALLNTEKLFTIRVPKVVKTSNGWRIAGNIDIDPTLETFLESGMYLDTEMMAAEHYPFPLEVGNYWKYDVYRITGEGASPGVEDDKDNPGEMITDMIVEIVKKEGYKLVHILRTSSLEDVKDQRITWVASARRIYQCNRDCQYQIDNLSYLLHYMLRRTPIYVFPLKDKQAWSAAGKRDKRNRYEVTELQDIELSTPAGTFSHGYKLTGSVEEGREERDFVPGLGVVQRTLRTGAGIKKEVLRHYRLIL